MRLKMSFIPILITACLLSCSNQKEQKVKRAREDSLREADSVSKMMEKQRIIDSVNLVTREQQIIADSIRSQVTN
jgi:hypothetical protein